MSTSLNVNTPLSPGGSLMDNSWLSVMVGHLPQAVLLEDSTHTIRIVNAQFCKLFGLSVRPEDITGKSTSDVNTEFRELFENTSHFVDRVKKLSHQKKATLNEAIKLKDGRILLRDYIPLWQEGVFAGHLWLYSDDTEKINAEALLQEQRKFYEGVLNNIPSDIAVFSPEHKYLYINPVGLRDPELRKWLIGKTDYDYCMLRGKDVSFADQRRNVFNEIIASGKEKEWEEKIINKQGETEFHLRKMSPLYDENKKLVWVIGYSVNITERKKIEEKIQLSERRYRDLFNYSQAIICTHDLQGNFLSVNPSLLSVLGYGEKEIIGKNLKEFLLPEDHAGFNDQYLATIQTGNKVSGVFRVLHKSGKRTYLLYQNYKVAESPEDDAYIIAFAQDVTDRIKAEKELKEAKKITEETARNKEKFLANMSHEIRTPMSGIIGITSFLQKTTLTEEQRNYLNIVQESANDLLTIINDILDLEKAGTGKIELENIPFDIVAKTNTVVRLFEVAAKNKGIELRFENKLGSKLFVAGDPTRFNQVLNNLISNAVKFTPGGKIIVKAEAAEETTDLITLRFAVEDTGIGIDPNNADKIFQPFTQAYPETTRKYGGTGLGLAISKNLVELQGGVIGVNSRPKHGSSFYFTIPYSKCAETPDIFPSALPPVNELGALKILFAEDNEVNQLLTEGILQQLGFKPVAAKTGVEVMHYVSANDVDLILMDIQMPEKNGYEATKDIRKLPGEKKNIPIIAVTANAFKGEEKEYLAAGMNGYITKPFTADTLYRTIAGVFREKTVISSNNAIMSQNIPPSTDEKLYDLTLVSDLARGNQEFIINLAKIFIETVPPTSKEMAEACAQKKWEQMGKLAHKLKSTIDTMCIHSLKDDIRFIEKNGKEQKNLEAMPELVQKADSVIKQVAAQLQAEFNL